MNLCLDKKESGAVPGKYIKGMLVVGEVETVEMCGRDRTSPRSRPPTNQHFWCHIRRETNIAALKPLTDGQIAEHACACDIPHLPRCHFPWRAPPT